MPERNHLRWDWHPIFTPEAWYGAKVKRACLAAIEWIWQNTPCMRIEAEVPRMEHRANLNFCPQIGMDFVGIAPGAFARGGKLRDLVLFGISRPVDGR